MAKAFAVSQFESLRSTPEKVLPLPDLERVVQDVWQEFKNSCDINSVVLNVRYDYDLFSQIEFLNTLAVADRTMWLINGVWVPAALLPEHLRYLGGSIDVKLNPYVPNGWFVDDGTCQIGNHFDLKTVLRHEFLHGIGVSSSFKIENNTEDVGFPTTSGGCYPFLMDLQMQTASGEQVVSGCTIQTNVSITDDLFVNGVEIYNPSTYDPGSSYHHAAASNTLIYYGIPARKCMYISQTEKALLEGIGAECTGNFAAVVTPSGASRVVPDFSVFILLSFLTICLTVRSVH